MSIEGTINKGRDSDGNLVTPLDEFRCNDSYSVAATDLLPTAVGLQMFTIATDEEIYITRIYMAEKGSAAETVTIYDGTVAGADILWSGTFGADGTIDIENLVMKACVDTNGIFIASASASSFDVTVGAKRVKVFVE